MRLQFKIPTAPLAGRRPLKHAALNDADFHGAAAAIRDREKCSVPLFARRVAKSVWGGQEGGGCKTKQKSNVSEFKLHRPGLV